MGAFFFAIFFYFFFIFFIFFLSKRLYLIQCPSIDAPPLMIKALALAGAAALAAIAVPTAAQAEYRTGYLAGYYTRSYDGVTLDVHQISGPNGTISVAVTCDNNGDYTWVGNPGDGSIVEAAVQQWCF